MSISSLTDNPPLLVGRDRELAMLREHLSAARAGHGSLVLIGGEAGIGKTALAESLCREATEQGALVLTGRAFDLSDAAAYGPWLYLFERYQQDDGPPLPPAFATPGVVGDVASQSVLIRAVLDFLKTLTAVRPTVLLLDDAQWFDPASLDLLRFLGHSVSTLPLLILVTYRSEDLTAELPLHRLLPHIVREAHAERLDLRPLDDAAVHTLVDVRYDLNAADAARLISHLQARAAGNVLFIGELLRSLEEGGMLRRDDGAWRLGPSAETGVPRLLRQVIDARVERLSHETQHLLRIACVVGQEVAYAVWGAVAGVEEGAVLDAVGEAETAHIMAEGRDGTSATFAHALIRESIYESIRPSQRRTWHRVAGEALAAMPGADAHAVASHFQTAQDVRAREWLIKAGASAQRAFAWLTAAERYEAAAALIGETGSLTEEQGWLLFHIARMRRYNNPAQSARWLAEAQRVAGATGDEALAAITLYSAGIDHFLGKEPERAIAAMSAGVAALEALSPVDQERIRHLDTTRTFFDLRTCRGPLLNFLAGAGRYADVLTMRKDFLPPPLPTVSRSPGPSPDGDGYVGLGTAYAMLGRPEQARGAYDAARAAYHAAEYPVMLGWAAVYELLIVMLTYATEDLAERRRLATEADEAWVRAAGTGYVDCQHLGRVPLMAVEGEWGEACSVLRTGAGSPVPQVRIFAQSLLGPLARERGDRDVAWTQIRGALPAGLATAPATVPYHYFPVLALAAADLCLDDDDVVAGQHWLTAHDGWMATTGAVRGRGEGCLRWARYYRAIGNPARANECATQAMTQATKPRQPLVLLAAHRMLGELDTDARQYPAAAAHLDLARSLATACAAPYERALTLLAEADLHAATGKRAEAVTLLEEVRTICAALGATPAHERAETLTAQIASAPQATAYPAGLSTREVEVLRLLAAGRTNRDIAAALFLSERTIDAHVRNILTKTNMDNRAAAARWAAEHRLV